MSFTGNPSEAGVSTSSNPQNLALDRQSPLFKFFYNFRVTFHTLLGPFLNRLTNRGRLLVGALSPEWVCNIIPALRNNGDMVPTGPKWRVGSRDLKSGCFLGQGCSGIFYKTEWTDMNPLARKDIPGVSSDVFEDEATRLVDLDHPNVVKCYCWTVNRGSCTLVMEYVKQDLYTVIQKRKEEIWKAVAPSCGSLLSAKQGRRAAENRDNFPFKLCDAIPIMLEIAKGIEYLHGKGIIHGDLKPNNILIDLEERPIKVKVGDFGLIESKRMTTLIPEHAFCYRMIEWSAPEMFEEYFDSRKEDLDYIWTPSLTESSDMNKASAANSYSSEIHPLTEKADSYSFALTCTYILGGKMWNANLSPSELRERISCKTRPERPKLPPECPKTLKALILLCWDHDPRNRLTFSEIRTKLEEILVEVSSASQSEAVPTPQVPVEHDACRGSSESGTETSAAMENKVDPRSTNVAPAAIDGDADTDTPPASDFEEGVAVQQDKSVPRLNAGDEFEETPSDCHSDNPTEEFTEHRTEGVTPLTALEKLKSVIAEENEFCQGGERSHEAAKGLELDEAAESSRELDEATECSRELDEATECSMELDEATSYNMGKVQGNDRGSIGVSENACPANQQTIEIKIGNLPSTARCNSVMEASRVVDTHLVNISPSSTLKENASVQQEAEMEITNVDVELKEMSKKSSIPPYASKAPWSARLNRKSQNPTATRRKSRSIRLGWRVRSAGNKRGKPKQAKFTGHLTDLFHAPSDDYAEHSDDGDGDTDDAAQTTFLKLLMVILEEEKEYDLGPFIDWKSASCLNENPKLTFANALLPGLKQNNDVHLESNEDDGQLLLFIRFHQVVKIHSLIISGPPGQGPKTLKLFVNKPNMDFTNVNDPVTETVILTPENLEGNQPIPLKCAKYRNVECLTLFIEDNQENDEVTRLQKLCFIGKMIETTNMTELKEMCLNDTYNTMAALDELEASQREKHK